jgi:NADPH:quinone reductase-like Zn-dependent oxidoreductase
MKAAVVDDFGQPLRVEDMPKPEPDVGEVVVRIEASGLCHTDIHASRGDWPVKPKLPLIPGHEGVGIVESVGDGVTEVKEVERGTVDARLVFDLGSGEPTEKTAGVLTEERGRPTQQPTGEAEEHRGPLPG